MFPPLPVPHLLLSQTVALAFGCVSALSCGHSPSYRLTPLAGVFRIFAKSSDSCLLPGILTFRSDASYAELYVSMSMSCPFDHMIINLLSGKILKCYPINNLSKM